MPWDRLGRITLKWPRLASDKNPVLRKKHFDGITFHNLTFCIVVVVISEITFSKLLSQNAANFTTVSLPRFYGRLWCPAAEIDRSFFIFVNLTTDIVRQNQDKKT